MILLQGPPPPPEPPSWAMGSPHGIEAGPCGGPCIPIDQGVLWVVVIGLIIGCYFLYQESKKYE